MTLVSSSLLVVNFTAKFQREHRERAPNERRVETLVIFSQSCVRNGARYDHGYYGGLIGSRIRTFVWYQTHRPWMTLNGRYTLCSRKDASFGILHKNAQKLAQNAVFITTKIQ